MAGAAAGITAVTAAGRMLAAGKYVYDVIRVAVHELLVVEHAPAVVDNVHGERQVHDVGVLSPFLLTNVRCAAEI